MAASLYSLAKSFDLQRTSFPHSCRELLPENAYTEAHVYLTLKAGQWIPVRKVNDSDLESDALEKLSNKRLTLCTHITKPKLVFASSDELYPYKTMYGDFCLQHKLEINELRLILERVDEEVLSIAVPPAPRKPCAVCDEKTNTKGVTLECIRCRDRSHFSCLKTQDLLGETIQSEADATRKEFICVLCLSEAPLWAARRRDRKRLVWDKKDRTDLLECSNQGFKLKLTSFVLMRSEKECERELAFLKAIAAKLKEEGKVADVQDVVDYAEMHGTASISSTMIPRLPTRINSSSSEAVETDPTATAISNSGGETSESTTASPSLRITPSPAAVPVPPASVSLATPIVKVSAPETVGLGKGETPMTNAATVGAAATPAVISGAASPSPEVVPIKRGRGRPRKHPLPEEGAVQEKRKRGRPRKHPLPEGPSPSPSNDDDAGDAADDARPSAAKKAKLTEVAPSASAQPLTSSSSGLPHSSPLNPMSLPLHEMSALSAFSYLVSNKAGIAQMRTLVETNIKLAEEAAKAATGAHPVPAQHPLAEYARQPATESSRRRVYEAQLSMWKAASHLLDTEEWLEVAKERLKSLQEEVWKRKLKNPDAKDEIDMYFDEGA